MIKKLSIYTLLLLFTTNLFAQTWEKLGCDTTGFLNMDKNSTAVLKNYNQTNYVSEFRDVYKFGNYGWKKIQSLNALTIDYDFLVIENDTVIYAYVLNSTITVVKTKDTYLSTIGTANFSSIKANTIKISRSVNGSLVISFLSNSGNLLKVMSYINNVWQDLGTLTITTAVSGYAISNKNDKPTIAYKKNSDSKIYITQFDGTNWIDLGGSIDPNWSSNEFDICQTTDGTPNVIYKTNNDDIILKKWSGTVWTTQTTLPRVPTGVYSHIKLATSNDIIYIGYNYGTSTRSFGIKKLYGTTLSQVGPATINSFVSTYFISSNNGDVTVFHPHDLWGGKFLVSTWNNTTWDVKEAASISKGITGISTITGVDKVIHTAFKDNSSGGKISVMKYINGAWVYAGLPGFSSMAGDNTTLAYDANNVLHVFFVGTNQKLYAYKLVANQWEEISQNWNAGGQLKSIYAKFNSNNTLYITCHAGTNNGATDYGFAYICTTANVLSDLPTIWSDNISSISMDLDLNGLPVVAFTDYKTTYEIYVKRYNGTSWSNASTTNVSSNGANQATVAVDNSGIIHIGFNSWVEQGYIIKKLIGNNWTTVAAQKPSTANVALPTLLFNENNELAAFYSENNQIKARLLKNGVWSDLGNTNFNDVYGNKLSISFQGGNYYLAHSYLGGFAYRLVTTPDVTTDFKNATNGIDNFMYYYNYNLYAKESTQVSINTIQGCEVFNGIGSTFNLIGLKPGIYIANTGQHQCKFIVE